MSIKDYQTILNSTLPDAVFEQFWLMFKTTVEDRISTRTSQISETLNQIQREGKSGWVDEIRQLIETFLYETTVKLMPTLSEYKVRILDSNLKRWIKLSTERGFTVSSKVYLSQAITHTVYRDIKDSEYDKILRYIISDSVSTGNNKLIGKLIKTLRDDTQQIIQSLYGINLPNGIKDGSKVLNFIKNHNVFKTV